MLPRRRQAAKGLLSVFCASIIFAAKIYAVETPTGIYFDEVSVTTIVASCYATTPAFAEMGNGHAGVNVPKNVNKWSSKTAMPTARQYPASGVIGGKLYIVGGSDGSGNLNTNEEYDPAANTWSTKAAMPTARYAFSAGVIGGKLYAVGGSGAGNLTTNEVYDPIADTWSTKAPMHTARHALAVGVAGGKLYAVGGWNGAPLNNNEEYKPATDVWTIKAAMPMPRAHTIAGTIGGKIYFAAGHGANLGILPANVELYDPATDTWTSKAAMPTPRAYAVGGVAGGKLYIVGGVSRAGGTPVSTNEEFDPAANAWSTKTGMPTARYGLGGGVIGSKLYAVGGYTGSVVLNTNEEFDPGAAIQYTGLTPNTRYDFKAKARDADGAKTAESPVVSTYTLAAIPLPASPVFTSVGESYFTLNWLPDGNPRGTRYKAQISDSSAFTSAKIWNTSRVRAAFHGLTAGTLYYARVAALNGNGVMTDYASLGAITTTNYGTAKKTARTGENKPAPDQPAGNGANIRVYPGVYTKNYSSAAPTETPKPTGMINVAVAEFTGKNVSQADASIVADFIRTDLVETGRFNVMDRNNMDSILAEQKFENSGCTDQQCAVEIGKLLNVKQMVVGSLSKLLDTYYITVNVVDVETGKIISSHDGDAGNARDLKNTCQKIVKKISQK